MHILERATNPQNENIDTAAVEAFCALINKEKDGPLLAVKLLATRMHSKRELEALQTLHILDYSMQKCGALFQDEIGKFRFLNEMIKLVSPKYLGAHTPLAVKQKVLQLMYLWMLDYPKQSKIKDAYDMLKKQGVIKDVPLSVSADYQLERQQHNTIFQDEEKGKLLKKLLQSKNPEDLQAANRLIKTMVKEDEKKAELKSRRISELESVQNNIRLLNEMLDSFKVGVSSTDETELIKELHESCVRMRPSITKLASETQQNDEILSEVLRINDELGQVFDKYHVVMVLGQVGRESSVRQTSLLDLSVLDRLDTKKTSNVDVLCDILSPIGDDILKPTAVGLVAESKPEESDESKKKKAFETLDALSETLLLENLQTATRLGSQFNKSPNDKIPMNLLQKSQSQSSQATSITNHTLNPISSVTFKSNNVKAALDLDAELSLLLETNVESHHNESSNALDDLLVDITTTPASTPAMTPTAVQNGGTSASGTSEKTEIKHTHETDDKVLDSSAENKNAALKLSDLFVDLKSIKPSGIEPIVALNEQNGVALTLHFAKDKPHQDVSVMVVSIANKNELPMKNVLFRAIVPKVSVGCLC